MLAGVNHGSSTESRLNRILRRLAGAYTRKITLDAAAIAEGN
jgi:hypothetical protein